MTVNSYLDDVETTVDLIDGVLVFNSPAVQVRFKYPGDARKGRHVLRFTVALAGGGVNEFAFGYVEVR